jgi:hypothetical protein
VADVLPGALDVSDMNGKEKQLLLDCASKLHDVNNRLTVMVTNLGFAREAMEVSTNDVVSALECAIATARTLSEIMSDISKQYRTLTDEHDVVE